MSLQKVCSLYMEGLRLRDQAAQLSQPMLAKKFERSPRTISKVVNGIPCNVPEDEQRLIRECSSERDRLKSKASKLSLMRLCTKYRISHHTVVAELERLDARRAAA